MVETVYKIAGVPRIALLADLHGRPYDHIISSLQQHKPTLICLAGDFIYGSWPEDDRSPLETQELVLPFFRACATIAPTYFSLGNHEQMLDDADLAAIEATGVVVLDNGWVDTVVDGRKIVLAGLTSAYVTDYRAFRGEIETIQYFTGFGLAEFDDIISNGLGGLIGFWIGHVQIRSQAPKN